jgi:hypothetical protein
MARAAFCNEDTSMRSRTRFGSCLLFVVLAPVAVAAAGGDLKIVAGPCLQNPGAGAMTVVWVTDRNATGWVEYGPGTKLTRKAVTSRDGLIAADCRLHRVTVTGLEPGTAYRYRVAAREIVNLEPYKVTYGATAASAVHEFRTLDPAAKEFSFVVLNDLHDQVGIMKKLMALAAAKPFDLVFLNGDIINDPQSEEQILRAFLRPCAETFAAKVPLVFVRGNHEARGRCARALRQYLLDPGQQYYTAFGHGPVRFVVLDSGEDKEDATPVYAGLADFDRYRSEQAAWLERVVAAPAWKAARFRIALTHIPLYGAGKRHGSVDCREKWGKLLTGGGLDLHIAAHLHRPGVIAPEPGVHGYPIVIGGAPREGRATLIRVDVTTAELAVTVVTDASKNLHRLRIPARGRDAQALRDNGDRDGSPAAGHGGAVQAAEVPPVKLQMRR